MSRGTILFLEANQDLQSLVSTWLREQGFEVESALGVREARTLLACLRVDAAIVDEQPPELPGTDFVQELRQKYPALPLIFTSASPKDPKLAVGCVLHKPYTSQELLLCVEQVLASRPAPATTGVPARGLGTEDEVDATLRALREEYGARLEEKVRELTAALERARAGNAEALEECFQLAHKLHGTAGSYGFGTVSESAGRLEALLKPARGAGAAVDWSALDGALREMTSEAARGAPAAPALEPEPPTAEESHPAQPAGAVAVARRQELDGALLTWERAERDSLTGLLLRRPFLENLRARLADTQRQGRSLALGFLDVDRFKKVNDTHGHLAGDQVLMQFGRLLSTRFRKEDLRCRWGGEEFVVALLGTTTQGARGILARTAAELARVEFEGDKGERFHVTFSAGLAVTPQDGTDVETLLRLADERLYRAKAQGGNRIES